MRPRSPTTIRWTHEQWQRPPSSSAALTLARRILYASHFFNQFSEQTWQFCVVIILAAVADYHSLFLVASYGLASYAAV